MRGINKVILLGNIGKDIELRYTANGKAVVSLSLATGEHYNNEQGEKQQTTEWHRLIFWDKKAELINEYAKKGTRIYIEGKNKTTKWTDSNNVERYTTNVVVELFNIESGGKKEFDESTEQQAQEPATYEDVFDENVPF